MLILPPPGIAPAEEVRTCPRLDPKCYFETTNDVLEAFSKLKSEASALVPTSGGGGTAYPALGSLRLTGLAPQVIVAAAAQATQPARHELPG
jgi:hypothetical protein